MNIDEATEYIHGLSINARKNNPIYMRRLLALLGNPHKEQKYIHVAGTNGKGSTVNYINNILIESGFKTGLYTSPHITYFSERFKVNNEKISQLDFINTFNIVKNKVQLLVDEKGEEPSIFEFLTAMAFRYFKKQECDIVVLETGMGGENDPTNIIDSTEIAVITKVAMDHINYIGPNIDDIIKEKSGIIKKDCNVILYSQSTLIEKNIRRKAKEVGAKIEIVDFKNIKDINKKILSPSFSYKDINNIRIRQFGDHQIKNAAVAIEIAFKLIDRGFIISEKAILKGLEVSKWPGRTEVLKEGPAVILDGAHNEDGISTLLESLTSYFNGQKIIFVFGSHTNKDFNLFARMISKKAKHIFTFTPNYHNALSSFELENFIKNYTDQVTGCNTITEAIDEAIEYANSKDVICITGTLFCIGEVYDYFGKLTD